MKNSIYNSAFEEIAGLFKDTGEQLERIYTNLNRSTLTDFIKNIPTGEFIRISEYCFEVIIKTKNDSLAFDFNFVIDWSNDDPQIDIINFTHCAIFNIEGAKVKDLILEDTNFEVSFCQYILNNLETFNY